MKDLQWFVTLSDRGYWIEQAKAAPNNAVRGPYASHAEAMASMDRQARRDAKTGRVAAWLVIAWVALLLVMAGAWLIGVAV
jgi:hypothetical protein